MREGGVVANWSRVAVFFFSSRRRHTRFKCDWSSDVCSSDLARWSELLREFLRSALLMPHAQEVQRRIQPVKIRQRHFPRGIALQIVAEDRPRSEERRVGKECRSRWSPYH